MTIKRIRLPMESCVIAYNCFLKNSASEMDNIALLRNMHPLDRSWFAKQLYSEGILEKYELKEFVEID